MANPARESIRKYVAVYAHFIAINVAVARRRTGDLLSAGSLLPRIAPGHGRQPGPDRARRGRRDPRALCPKHAIDVRWIRELPQRACVAQMRIRAFLIFGAVLAFPPQASSAPTSSLRSLPANSRSNSSRFAPGGVTNAATATARRRARSARTRPVSRPTSRASSSRMAERWQLSPMGMSICVPQSMPSASPHAGGSRRCLGRGPMRRIPTTCTSTSSSTGRATATASVNKAIAADQSRISDIATRCGVPMRSFS
jgi:hypothetical protein